MEELRIDVDDMKPEHRTKYAETEIRKDYYGVLVVKVPKGSKWIDMETGEFEPVYPEDEDET